MLIAEALLLLLLDDDKGKMLADRSTQVDPVLGGALLVELAIAGRVDVAGQGEAVKPGRLVVRDPAPMQDPLLNTALDRLRQLQGAKPSAVIGKLAKGTRDAVLARLVAAGAITETKSKVLGIFRPRPGQSSTGARKVRCAGGSPRCSSRDSQRTYPPRR